MQNQNQIPNSNNEVHFHAEFNLDEFNNNNQNKQELDQGLENLDISNIMLIKNPNNDIVLGIL